MCAKSPGISVDKLLIIIHINFPLCTPSSLASVVRNTLESARVDDSEQCGLLSEGVWARSPTMVPISWKQSNGHSYIHMILANKCSALIQHVSTQGTDLICLAKNILVDLCHFDQCCHFLRCTVISIEHELGDGGNTSNIECGGGYAGIGDTMFMLQVAILDWQWEKGSAPHSSCTVLLGAFP